jgi:hypothetical protein
VQHPARRIELSGRDSQHELAKNGEGAAGSTGRGSSTGGAYVPKLGQWRNGRQWRGVEVVDEVIICLAGELYGVILQPDLEESSEEGVGVGPVVMVW